MTLILQFMVLYISTKCTITEAISTSHHSETHGHEPVEYVPKTCPPHSGLLICCDGALRSKSVGPDCCGTIAYDKSEGECCDNALVTRPPLKCCGKRVYNPVVQQCCGRTPVALGPQSMKFQCCGQFAYNSKIQQCCEGIPHSLGIPSAPLSCCANIIYNPKISICCPENELHIIPITTPNGCNNTIGQMVNFVLRGKVVHESHSALGAISASRGG